MSNLPRYRCDMFDEGNGEYADMRECDYGSYVSVWELRKKLQKALADAAPDGSSDAYRTVLEWLGEE